MEQDKIKKTTFFDLTSSTLISWANPLPDTQREEKPKRNVSKISIIVDLAGGWSQFQREVRQREAARGLAWPSQL
jgi:hypothetical protein